MSRLAKKPLPIPSGVSVSVENGAVSFKGPLGTIVQSYDMKWVKPRIADAVCFVDRFSNSKEARAKQGLYWALFRNALIGVSSGFIKKLEIQGIGYRWEVKGKELHCSVGFSHPVIFKFPDEVTLEQPVANQVHVRGFDKQIVGQVAANIRFIKPPEPYKGKGIRYQSEVVRLKEGKSGGKKK